MVIISELLFFRLFVLGIDVDVIVAVVVVIAFMLVVIIGGRRIICKLRLIWLFVLVGLIELEVLLLAQLVEVYLVTVNVGHVKIAIFFGKRIVVFLCQHSISRELRSHLLLLYIRQVLFLHYFLQL